jgi:hypothetical protein
MPMVIRLSVILLDIVVLSVIAPLFRPHYNY